MLLRPKYSVGWGVAVAAAKLERHSRVRYKCRHYALRLKILRGEACGIF
jgi:hypothetical protein